MEGRDRVFFVKNLVERALPLAPPPANPPPRLPDGSPRPETATDPETVPGQPGGGSRTITRLTSRPDPAPRRPVQFPPG